MKDDGVDVLLVFHPPHVFYLSGFQTFSPYNSECAILPANGSLLLIVDPMEIGGALIHIRSSSVSKGTTRHSAGFPKAELVDGSTIVPKVKATKSSEEVAHLRRSASITNVGVEAAIDAIKAGKADNDDDAYDLGIQEFRQQAYIRWTEVLKEHDLDLVLDPPEGDSPQTPDCIGEEAHGGLRCNRGSEIYLTCYLTIAL